MAWLKKYPEDVLIIYVLWYRSGLVISHLSLSLNFLWTENYARKKRPIRIISSREESIISLVDCAQRKREFEDIYCKINTFNAELRCRARGIEYDRDAILSCKISAR